MLKNRNEITITQYTVCNNRAMQYLRPHQMVCNCRSGIKMRKVYIEINYGKNNGKMGNRKTLEETERSIGIYPGRDG